jgi:hypothetical protein
VTPLVVATFKLRLTRNLHFKIRLNLQAAVTAPKVRAIEIDLGGFYFIKLTVVRFKFSQNIV